MRDDEEVAAAAALSIFTIQIFECEKRSRGEKIIVIKAGWFQNKSGTRRRADNSWLPFFFRLFIARKDRSASG